MGRRSIIQTLFYMIRNFTSRLSDGRWTQGEMIFIALLILIVITAAILFGASISKKRGNKEYQ